MPVAKLFHQRNAVVHVPPWVVCGTTTTGGGGPQRAANPTLNVSFDTNQVSFANDATVVSKLGREVFGSRPSFQITVATFAANDFFVEKETCRHLSPNW